MMKRIILPTLLSIFLSAETRTSGASEILRPASWKLTLYEGGPNVETCTRAHPDSDCTVTMGRDGTLIVETRERKPDRFLVRQFDIVIRDGRPMVENGLIGEESISSRPEAGSALALTATEDTSACVSLFSERFREDARSLPKNVRERFGGLFGIDAE